MKAKSLLLVIILLISCKTPEIYKNFSNYKKLEEIAILEFDGFLLKVQDETKNYYDILLLVEGKYLIEFRDRNHFIKGASLCELKANKIYTIQITQKKEFPKLNKIVYLGECIEVDRKKTNIVEKYFLDKKL